MPRDSRAHSPLQEDMSHNGAVCLYDDIFGRLLRRSWVPATGLMLARQKLFQSLWEEKRGLPDERWTHAVILTLAVNTPVSRHMKSNMNNFVGIKVVTEMLKQLLILHPREDWLIRCRDCLLVGCGWSAITWRSRRGAGIGAGWKFWRWRSGAVRAAPCGRSSTYWGSGR